MKRRGKKQRRERIVMMLSGLFVLTALTITGVYVREKGKTEEDYVVDLSGLEETKQETEGAGKEEEEAENSQLVNSAKVDNPPLPTQEQNDQTEQESQAQIEVNTEVKEEPLVQGEVSAEKANEEKTQAAEEELVFPEGERLTWPVTGNVLISYSMDKPVYFASLEQYKVNPGIVIQATEGQQINAAVRGKIEKIVKEEETGNTIYMNIGSGYQTVYGQLTNIQVKEGDLVEKGAYLADVAAPTKYYSVEGCNVYFALLKEGKPVDPMGKLE